MTKQKQCLVRMADAIHRRLCPNVSNNLEIQLPIAEWGQCETLKRKLQLARDRGWQLAAARLQTDFCETVERLRWRLLDLGRQIHASDQIHSHPSTKDIYADLDALRNEFEGVTLDLQGRTLSCTTEAIELGGVHLGSFEIRLDWTDLLEGHPGNYRVVAIDPNPAAANDNVTHPHVQDESVCEGEGRRAIRDALEQGRLLDFFLIVANLLRTYNADSPFISLSQWQGLSCVDCGSIVGPDDRWTCESCETTICARCHYICPDCGGAHCDACVAHCETCDENHCKGCLRPCAGCRAELCQACLNDNERCFDCYEQELEEEKDFLGNDQRNGVPDAFAPI